MKDDQSRGKGLEDELLLLEVWMVVPCNLLSLLVIPLDGLLSLSSWPPSCGTSSTIVLFISSSSWSASGAQQLVLPPHA